MGWVEKRLYCGCVGVIHEEVMRVDVYRSCKQCIVDDEYGYNLVIDNAMFRERMVKVGWVGV